MDPFGITDAFQSVEGSWRRNSRELNVRILDLIADLQRTSMEEAVRIAGVFPQGPPDEGKPGECLLETVRQNTETARKIHGHCTAWLRDMVARGPGLSARERDRAAFWIRQVIQILSPANFFWTNPAAVLRCLNSEGGSLRRGVLRWIEDQSRGEFLPPMVDRTAFRPGENIGTADGVVVHRNELMELIQYRPATDRVYAVPLVFIQPWINKYYIFDLEEETSFVRYLTRNGFTVFITSWRNPGPEMRGVTLDDYMLRGALEAVRAARSICRVPAVHAAGYCIGGTVLAALMAWLAAGNRGGGEPVADWTLFSALTDFSEPGEMGFLVTHRSVSFVEGLMEQKGILDARLIDASFRLLRADSLIWRNFVNGYLYGCDPPKSNVLYWNSDSTNLPEAMASLYLRKFYLENRFAEPGGLVLGGRPLDLGRVGNPLYVVGALLDHISPWRGAFRTCRLTGGPVRYVLAGDGHITGIVNPPSEFGKKRYWAGEDGLDGEPDTWLAGREERPGSWWEDWTEWLARRSGPSGPPPPLGNRRHPAREKAPGTYVFG
ncbi:MAG: alpha/beta hydrolase [Syntrophaceae bacterium]|nr:alpha/beta hydrolase [Syntrophaceae bacterium]